MQAKRSIIITVLFVVANISNILSAENPDSLKYLLSATSNAERIMILNELGNCYLVDSPLVAFGYYSESYDLARELNIDSLKALASEKMGLAKSNHEEYRESEGYLSQALEYYKHFNNNEKIAGINKELGLIEYYQGNYEAAIRNYQKALKLFSNLNKEQQEADTYQNIGLVHHDLKNIDNALYYYNKSLTINEKLKNKNNIAGLTQNLGLIYLGNNKFDTAFEFINRSLDIYRELGKKEGIGISLSNIGLIYQEQEKYDKALSYYKESLTVFNEVDYLIGRILATHNVGTSYFNLKKYDKALEYYNKSLTMAQNANFIQGILANYEAISNLYSETNNFQKSLDYYKLFDSLEDSINTTESKERIMEMETSYKLELLDNELRNKSNELAQQKRLKYIFITGTIILFGLLLITIFAYTDKRHAEKELNEHRKKLEKLVAQKTDELKIEINERKIAEESDRLKSAFLSNMSHELRTPMNAIIAFTNFLKVPDLSRTKREEYINYVTSAGETLLGLIDDIIDIAKIEAHQLTISKSDCNITTICIELLNMFNELKNRKNKEHIILTLNPESIKNFIIIDTDGKRLRQILNNLLENALKYTCDGYIEFGFTRNESDIQFYVKDSGIGIPEEKFDYIFERFSQINLSTNIGFGGTGLGLAITKNLVKLLGGKIWLESELNVGTTFYFTIPYNKIKIEAYSDENTNAKRKASNSLITYDWSGKKILIAEDEDLNFKVLESVLSKTKAQLLRANNGIEAVNIFKENQINLVLMDIQMPDMDGYSATQEIKKINSRVPVVAQTSFAMEGEKEKCLLVGCNDYLSKPLNLNELLLKIDKYINL